MQHSCIIIKQLCNNILLKTGQSWAGIPISSHLTDDELRINLAFFFFFQTLMPCMFMKQICHSFSCLFCLLCGSENFHWSQIYKHNNHTSLKQIWMLSRTSVNSSSWALLPNRTWTKREDTRSGCYKCESYKWLWRYGIHFYHCVTPALRSISSRSSCNC